jgi:sugar-specific transcriptional regulator TrmB
MNLQNELKKIGLNKSEIIVYLFLLEEGLSTPPQISSGTRIARTNCYNILLSLKQKGLVEPQQRQKRKAYLATDPQSLMQSIEKKKEIIEQILPDLRSIHTYQKNKPKIKFYEGWEEVKEIYRNSLEAKEIFAIGSTKGISDIDTKFFDIYRTQIKEKQIVYHDILSHSSRADIQVTKELLKGYYDVTIVPSQYKNFQTDILIWGDNIALITLEEPIFGTVLTNKLLAETFRIIFNLMKEGIH